MVAVARRTFCRHGSATVGMVIDGEWVCIPCAARLYEVTGSQRLQAAWLLEHGRELDHDRTGASIPKAGRR